MVSAFISYSSKDLEVASRLHADLEANNVRIWRDEKNLKGGDFWDSRIEDALSDPAITHVIVLISSNSMSSEMVKNEVEYAGQRGKTLVPVIVGNYERRLLRLVRRHEIDLRNRYETGLQELLGTFVSSDNEISDVLVSLPSSHTRFYLSREQNEAAHDTHRLVRLIAAPGTGKSLVIEERVRWLLSQGIHPKQIAVVSFTRAASRDLKKRITRYCEHCDQPGGDEVSVTTLHSLAMKVLRKANKLHYPASPKVLDQWETENIFDREFSETKRDPSHSLLTKLTPGRAGEVRGAVEAYWNTRKWDHPSYIPPDDPVSDMEIEAFQQFHSPATQTYSCVLPGEIVKKCVDGVDAGTLNPASLLGLQHIVIDEYQDLNYTDQQFVEAFIASGCHVFVAGDDDQSIYSFRYAYPTGIQEFAEKHTNVSSHMLTECFRCTPDILNAGWKLICENQSPGRIPKSVNSFCKYVPPPITGVVHRWRFQSEQAEYQAIAHSCKALIDSGMKARSILVLISNRKALLPERPSVLQEKFQTMGLDVEMPTGTQYIDNPAGRFVFSLVRIACDINLHDYIAHRTMLGLLKGVGPKAYNGLRDNVVKHHLNYMDLFYNPLPDGIFSATEIRALNKARNVCGILSSWSADDTIFQRKEAIAAFVREQFSEDAASEWLQIVSSIPNDMCLSELEAFLATDNSEQQENILRDVYERLTLDIPEEGLLPQQVRIMTMHGAKGLNADVVIIPGLEEDILPGSKRARYPGMIQESARQLYVSITRARHAAIISYAESRMRYGTRQYNRSGSRFCDQLNGRFDEHSGGLSETEVQAIVDTKEDFEKKMEARQSMLAENS